MQVKNALISVSEHEKLSGPAWLMGYFRLLCLKKPNINKKPTKKPLNTTLPQQSHNPHPSSSFSSLVSLSQLPASTEKQQVTGKCTDYVGTHWELGQPYRHYCTSFLLPALRRLLRNEELLPLHPYQDTADLQSWAETATWQS